MVVQKERIILTRQELESLSGARGGPLSRDGLLVLVAGLCSLRCGEVTCPRVKRVDVARRRLLVSETAVTIGGRITAGTPKSHEFRSVPVPPSVLANLSTWIETMDKDALVFANRKGNWLHEGNWLRDVWRPGTPSVPEVPPKITPHDLRHTCASLLIRAGAPVKAVQEILGHSDPSTTLRIYSHLWPDDLDRWAAALDETSDGQTTDTVITEDLE